MKCFLLLFVVAQFSLQIQSQEITSTTEMEQQILEWTNAERAKVNAPPLRWNNRLALAARLHSDEMAKHKELSHQVKGEPMFTERLSERGARFSAAAENVGYSDDAEGLQSGWMHSPPHRVNLLNPAYTEMGVGIVRAGDRLWATEDFASTLQKLSSDDFERAIEQQVTSRRRARGLPPLKVSYPAELRRLACSGENSAGAAFGVVGHRNAQAYAFNFTAPQPEQLPADLMKRVLDMPSGSYSIGACASKPGSSGLSTYRTVMVLFH